jgi:hypothetical protein
MIGFGNGCCQETVWPRITAAESYSYGSIVSPSVPPAREPSLDAQKESTAFVAWTLFTIHALSIHALTLDTQSAKLR